MSTREKFRMAAVSMMSGPGESGGLMTDFSPEDDGFFTCAVSVQHKVSGRDLGGREGRSEKGSVTL